MPRVLPRLIGAAAVCLAAAQAHAFCGFYVGKADAGLFNEASQVILVRDGERTVISMLNDYKGDPTEFALVVPVPPGAASASRSISATRRCSSASTPTAHRGSRSTTTPTRAHAASWA